MQVPSFSANQDGNQDGRSSGTTYGYYWAWKIVGVVALTATVLLLVQEWIHWWQKDPFQLICWGAVAVVSLIQVGESFTTVVEVKGDKLVLRGPVSFRGRQIIRWTEVKQMRMGASGSEIRLYTDPEGDPALIIGARFEGLSHMADQIAGCLSEETKIKDPGGNLGEIEGA
ncbi:hypothetical protein [Salinibacter altiplanensis]|uniref:hypothetical protein n=1 Tax=Salinibacter altiplanensis TaxID=1803181 RepID=UPI000C9FEDEF|nr:hypothetical protein [Salinibacter altiplanensis]